MDTQPSQPGNTPDPAGPPPRDELDSLLRSWHEVNAERAAAGRDRLLARLRRERQPSREAPGFGESLAAFILFVRSAIMNRYSPVAATVIVMVAVIAVLMPSLSGPAYAEEIMVPDGGRLDAIDEEGNILGPCPLQHTDVDVRISAFLSRVNVTQTYQNPYEKKIEAVYTFPLSHRAAVDRMTMTIGDRVVVGEVKERELARRIYEAAREQGYVASLLEQERPNIFTQSVANIEPGAKVTVKISYVEVLQSADGTYSFDFPMVVGPRYVPGSPTVSPAIVPAELKPRHGLVLLGPAKLTVGAAGDPGTLGSLQTGKLNALLTAARPIMYPGDAWWGRGDATGGAGQGQLWYRFEAQYCDGSKELGELYTDGTGQLNGRWFYADPKTIEGMGTGFAQDTNQVPDASRITPEPVRPGERAGHDISVRVTIDTGGPGLVDVASELHEIVRFDEQLRDDGLPRKLTLALAEKNEIPNRDFVLSWGQTADAIQEATFTHTSQDLGDYSGGFFTLILQPPDRVEDADIPPRELIFVMDTSGSMRGFPIEKSKEVMTRAIDAMRPDDTFNVITFAGTTDVLWDKPRPATADNRAAARSWVESRKGRGGTEMMKAINKALVQTVGTGPVPLSPKALADLPADNRPVEVRVPYGRIQVTGQPEICRIPVEDDLNIRLRLKDDLPPVFQPEGVFVILSGRWYTEHGRRVLVADRVRLEGRDAQAKPMRIVLFLTDGYVGNDMAIIDAARANAHTTRVFSFGIGNSVNRYLLEGMARAGRGEVEFVLLSSDADEAVTRFTKRVETPVLTDIELAFGEGLDVVDLLPSPGAIPDLFDAKPLVIHGRYSTPGKGTLTVRGRTGAGPYERTVELELPEQQADHDVIATLWARARVGQVMAPHLKAVQEGRAPQAVRQEVIALGEQFQIMSQFTSFVAVEKSRMTIGGKPVLVAVPIEMPEGVSYEGVFGEAEGAPQLALGEPLSGGVKLGVQRGEARSRALGRRMYADAGSRGPGAPVRMSGDAKKGKRAAPGTGFATESRMRHEAAGPLRAARPAPGKGGGVGGGGRGGGVFGDPGDDRAASQEADALRESLSKTTTLVVADAAKSEEDLNEVFALLDAEKPSVAGTEAREAIAVEEKAPGVPLLGDISLAGELLEQPSRPLTHVEGRPIFAEHVALAVADHVEKDKLEEALALAQALAEARPDYEIGVKMRDALTDESLTDDERHATIAGLADQAAKDLEAAVAEAKRKARLARVLDPALRAMAEGKPMVTVLVTKVDDDTTKALTEAGLDIEAASKSLPIVVGTVDVARLETLALLEAVRRIEPTRMSAGAS
jgi:hypothetical protein